MVEVLGGNGERWINQGKENLNFKNKMSLWMAEKA